MGDGEGLDHDDRSGTKNVRAHSICTATSILARSQSGARRRDNYMKQYAATPAIAPTAATAAILDLFLDAAAAAAVWAMILPVAAMIFEGRSERNATQTHTSTTPEDVP